MLEPRAFSDHARDMRFEPARVLLAIAFAGMTTLVGCGTPPPRTNVPPPSKSPYTGYVSKTYSDTKMWLCLPGRANDVCAGDLGATEIRADGSLVVEPSPSPPAHASKVDCFYVYPTMDNGTLPGNHEDFSDTRDFAMAATAQAARFRDVCNVYVPLYRQMTIGTYLIGRQRWEPYAEVAESDVEDAFLHYLAQWNHGRKFVLIGHSQGGDMVARLLARYVDGDEGVRERMLYAMPLGYKLEVPKGKRVGGAFKNIPLCEREEDTGCVIAFRSFADAAGGGPSSFEQPKPDTEDACVSPSELLGNESARFSGAYFPLSPRIKAILGGVYQQIDTPFVVVRDYYAGRCKANARGQRFLAISAWPPDGDMRSDGVGLMGWRWRGFNGLHVLDMQFSQGDLVELVGRRAAALP
jgi:hypothetical protein